MDFPHFAVADAPVVVRRALTRWSKSLLRRSTQVVDSPLVCNDRCLVVKVQKTVEAPQLQGGGQALKSVGYGVKGCSAVLPPFSALHFGVECRVTGTPGV